MNLNSSGYVSSFDTVVIVSELKSDIESLQDEVSTLKTQTENTEVVDLLQQEVAYLRGILESMTQTA